MLSLLMPRACRLTRVQCVTAGICALSLIILLANRFPRIEGNEQFSWVPSAPSHLTAKLMAKDFFVLQSPAAVRILLPRSVPMRIEISEERPAVSLAQDSRLFTRPPPSA
jgi:hypothetical protein